MLIVIPQFSSVFHVKNINLIYIIQATGHMYMTTTLVVYQYVSEPVVIVDK